MVDNLTTHLADNMIKIWWIMRMIQNWVNSRIKLVENVTRRGQQYDKMGSTMTKWGQQYDKMGSTMTKWGQQCDNNGRQCGKMGSII